MKFQCESTLIQALIRNDSVNIALQIITECMKKYRATSLTSNEWIHFFMFYLRATGPSAFKQSMDHLTIDQRDFVEILRLTVCPSTWPTLEQLKAIESSLNAERSFRELKLLLCCEYRLSLGHSEGFKIFLQNAESILNELSKRISLPGCIHLDGDQFKSLCSYFILLLRLKFRLSETDVASHCDPLLPFSTFQEIQMLQHKRDLSKDILTWLSPNISSDNVFISDCHVKMLQIQLEIMQDLNVPKHDDTI